MNRRSLLFSCTLGAFAGMLCPTVATLNAQQAAGASTQAQGPVSSCPVALPVSPGDEAMARGAFADAAARFTEEAKTAGAPGDQAHDGLIRALLHENMLADAKKDALQWSSAEPGNGWAQLAKAEVLWRDGRVAEAIPQFIAVGKTNGCLGQLHADMYYVLRLQGLYGSAAKQIGLAHRLDPQDPVITATWLRTQPRSVRLTSIQSQLEQDANLAADQRKALEQREKALSAAPAKDQCHLVTPVTSATIPFRKMRNGPRDPVYFGMDVAINGKGRRLQLDTGASGLIIYSSAASALQLPQEITGKAYGMGDNGSAATYASKVESIKIGGLEFANCYVEVIDDSNQRDSEGHKIDHATDGLIGADVFNSFLLTLDFPGMTVKLDPLPPVPGASAEQLSLDTDAKDQDAPPRDRYVDSSMKDWTRFYRSGHDIILPVLLNGGPIRMFIVDTGSDRNLISPSAAREVGKVSNTSDIDAMIGISGRTNKLYTTNHLTLSFAGLTQKTPGLTAMNMDRFGAGTGVEISGFIGSPTLHQLTMQIDYRDNLIHFNFDPSRLRRCVSNIQVDDCY